MKDEDRQEEQVGSYSRALRKMERKLRRAEERLVDYELQVDRTQHLLNTRIDEVEAARAALAVRTKELEESKLRFRQLADAAFEAIIIHAGEQILDCNVQATRLYRCSKEDLLAEPFLRRISSSVEIANHRWLYEPTDEPVELIHLRMDNEPVPVEIRSRAIVYKGVSALVTAVRDITAYKEMEDKLKRIANTDPLTGVGNRRFFLDSGATEYSRSERYSQPMSLMMLDVDHFKRINDNYGHEVGDLALKELVRVSRETLRDSDVLARIGGEEFAAILPGTDLAGSVALAERLRENVELNRLEAGEARIAFTVSIGVTDVWAADTGIESMLNRADKGLYCAKERGRNQVATE